MAWAQIPVTGTFIGLNGESVAGRAIIFSTTTVPTNAGQIVGKRVYTAILDANGAIPAGFTLPATNDPSIDPRGWAYTVNERFAGGRDPYLIYVPYTSSGLDLAAVVPVEGVDYVGLQKQFAAYADGVGANVLESLASPDPGNGGALVGYKPGQTVSDALDDLYLNRADEADVAALDARVDVLEASQTSGMIGFDTKASMDADLAHDAGVLALVTNDTTPSNNGTYRKIGASGSGAWVFSADRVTGLEGRMLSVEDAVADTMLTVPSVNLYDKSIAENGYSYQVPTGVKSAASTAIVSGHIPVQEGKTYTLSQPSPEAGFWGHVYCWNGATYLGMDANVSSNPVVSGMNLTTADPGGTGGYRKVTFTIPVGSGVTHIGVQLLFNYATHTAGDFDRIRGGVQMQEGTAVLPYQQYGAVYHYVLDAAVPSTVARTAQTTPLVGAFSVSPSRNLYDKSNALDGNTHSYSTGLPGVYAPGMALGYFPVVAGKTYTVSMGDALGFHSDHPIFCRDASGSFLGIDHTIGAATGMASPPTGVTWIGNSSVTFTISVGSAIRYIGFSANYSTHTTADFNRVVGTVQAEEGASATAYQPYAPLGVATLIPSALPQVATSLPMSLSRRGSALYIRGLFDDTYDIVTQVLLSTGVNSTVNVQGARKILRSAETVSGWNSGTVLSVTGDSSAPLNYNGTYIGANHGANFVQSVTATAHGKATQDVGSEWVDGAAIKWYLMKIVDANTLWFMPQNGAAYPAWSFTTAMTGNLTHSSGATNTGAITVGSKVLTQLTPAIQNQSARVFLDGVTEITGDGDYTCHFVDVVNSYDIASPAAVVTYVRGLVGGATQPSFIDPSIASDIHRTLTYRYSENGSCTITDGVRVLSTGLSWGGGYFPGTQHEALNYSGKQLWQYIPRVTAITGAIKTWNFASQEQIDGSMEQVDFYNANWSDANNPPDRLAQIVKTAGVAEFGVMIGASPVRGTGPAAIRKTLVTDALFVSAARKQYIKAVGPSAAIAQGSYYETVAYRSYWSAATCPQATTFSWYRDGKDIIVIADFHQNSSFAALKLPSQFVGRDIAVVDKTASATVHSSVLTTDGILVSITGGYGYVVLKIT